MLIGGRKQKEIMPDYKLELLHYMQLKFVQSIDHIKKNMACVKKEPQHCTFLKHAIGYKTWIN